MLVSGSYGEKFSDPKNYPPRYNSFAYVVILNYNKCNITRQLLIAFVIFASVCLKKI